MDSTFEGKSYVEFKSRLFLPADIIAVFLRMSGASEDVFRQAEWVESFLICFSVLFFIYLLVAGVVRRE